MRGFLIALAVVIVGVILYPACQIAQDRWELSRRIPVERDPRLVGVWVIEKPGPKGLFQFKADGTATRCLDTLDKVSMRLKWGTQNGRLHLSWPSIDSGPRFSEDPYEISPNGKRVTFGTSSTFIRQPWIRFEAEASARTP